MIVHKGNLGLDHHISYICENHIGKNEHLQIYLYLYGLGHKSCQSFSNFKYITIILTRLKI